MMLLTKYRGQNPAGWLASEKLDGCRAFWDGEVLRTRSWAAIRAPDFITAGLPRGQALDGELWAGRGQFELVRVLVQTDRLGSADWRRVRFCVFDAPTTDEVPIEQRLERARRLCARSAAQLVEHVRLTGAEDMWARFAAVVSGGGEGLVLKRAGSMYEFGRSNACLKLKPLGVD